MATQSDAGEPDAGNYDSRYMSCLIYQLIQLELVCFEEGSLPFQDASQLYLKLTNHQD